MDQQKTDQDLLREFTEHGLESAFQQLVRRHVDLVFATAVRRLGDGTTAQDLTQDVFIKLARKAAWLRGEVSLAGWLHRATVLEAQQWWRGELRRRRREQTAAELNTTMKEADQLFKSMAGVLDEGLMQLGAMERQTLILRFFEDRSYREIGAMLGAGEDAVRKRSDKALGKLTEFFRQRGYALPAGATVAAAFHAVTQAAPSGLATMAAQTAITSGSAASLAGAGLLFAKFMGLTYAQTTAVCLVLLAAPIAYEWRAIVAARAELEAQRQKLEQTQNGLLGRHRGLDRIQRQIRTVESSLADLRARPVRDATSLAKARADGEISPYLWSEESEFVRIPKTMLKQLNLVGRSERAPNKARDLGTFIGGDLPEDLLFPPLMKEVFGVTPDETARVNKALQTTWQEFQQAAQSRSFPTNRPPREFRLDDIESLTLFTAAFPDEGLAMRERLRLSLEAILGQERTEALWRQNQTEFNFQYDDFGVMERFETFAVGPEKTIGWSHGVRFPGDAAMFGCVGGRGKYPLDKVPDRFRSFVAEKMAKLENQP